MKFENIEWQRHDFEYRGFTCCVFISKQVFGHGYRFIFYSKIGNGPMCQSAGSITPQLFGDKSIPFAEKFKFELRRHIRDCRHGTLT